MRQRLGLGALALGLATLQTAASPSPAHLPRADLMLLFVLASGMRRGEGSGVLWGVALGFLAETFSAGPAGATMLSYGLLGFGAGSLRERLDCENPNTQALVAALATLAQGLTHLVLIEVLSEGGGVLVPLLGVVLTAAALNGALLPAGMWVPVALQRWRGRRRAAAPA